MRSLSTSRSHSAGSTVVRPMKAFADEVLAFLDAIPSPARIIAEVEQMRSLHLEANRIECSDPARAAVLRMRASRIGLN